ncbi:hypothetical protein Pedsa_2468 [Pseudopedobacter saltans DSM 12145]|uniref:Uncharacterized protein n=1 Tax=Pseudopedobacter saltans (strain ATCC 51119 / DSM 12145 / JCM 21818 / CCUG 39354 / LMG 10337 / NBRC 100064 / NCIMB 13643) TaxID=762903 RepID=F0SEU7_PSESL|nr:hypothetical protein [Pseudopedobacter saltans]ADY53013.1 hypothetical protein Pedsa_2468 [Pseudopedobacter saltans DSM 12145]
MKNQSKSHQSGKDVQGRATSDRSFVQVKEREGHRMPNASSASHANQERKPNQRHDSNELTKVDKNNRK